MLKQLWLNKMYDSQSTRNCALYEELDENWWILKHRVCMQDRDQAMYGDDSPGITLQYDDDRTMIIVDDVIISKCKYLHSVFHGDYRTIVSI